MDEGRIINYQRKFSNIQFAIVFLIAIILVEHEVYYAEDKILAPLMICIGCEILENVIDHFNFFQSITFVRAYRFAQIVAASVLLVTQQNPYIQVVMYLLILLLSVEFMITFLNSDKYYQYLSLVFAAAPVIALQVTRAITTRGNKVILSNIVCSVLTFIVLIAIYRCFSDEMNRLESRYLAQLRYVEDANEINHQLVENQEKIKKANEQLAYQKVQLEFAYRRINNVNMEISLQNQILKLISAHHDMEQLMEMIAATIRKEMNVDTFAIVLYPNAVATKNLIYHVQTSYGMQYQQFLGKQIEQGMFETYTKQNSTYVDNHVSVGQYSFARNAEVASLLIVPLRKAEKIIGALYVADSKYDAFVDNVAFFEATESSINLAIENSNLYARLEEMAVKDELTGIYNRRYLNQICDQYIFESLRDKTPLSVALFDIDKFKNVNDSYGHLFGDEAIKVVSSMASDLADKVGGVVGRYGGEEFVVLFPNRNLQSTYEEVKVYHDAIRNAIFYHNQEVVHIRLSVGISSFPETCLNPSELLNYADLAMYYSKQNGRDRITIDSSSIREQVRLK